MIAEEKTGKNWPELVRENRIIYRYALFCLSCGELDYYGQHDLASENRSGRHIWSIIHQPSTREAKRYNCRACGAQMLYPLCGQIGCLLALLNLIGLFRDKIKCPKCKSGLLKSEMSAIT